MRTASIVLLIATLAVPCASFVTIPALWRHRFCHCLASARLIQSYDTDADEEWPFSPSDLSRLDESDDADFYEAPRLVKHIDEWALLSLTAFYNQEISPSVDVLDLCSSWISHYPPQLELGRVVGVGMNQEELQANPRLNEYFVQDLNKDPSLGMFEDASFDVVTLALSVDYLVRPKEVFQDIHRVLRPGGVALIVFGNRYFKTKAIRKWLDVDEEGKRAIVAAYLSHSAQWQSIEAFDIKLKPDADTILEFVQKQSLFRWFATAIFRGTWATDEIYVVKATN